MAPRKKEGPHRQYATNILEGGHKCVEQATCDGRTRENKVGAERAGEVGENKGLDQTNAFIISHE